MNNIINIDKTEDGGFWNLIAEETKRYTKGRSSSVPTEVAKDIVRSVLFSVEQYIEGKCAGDWGKVPADISLDFMLAQGRNIVKSKVSFGKRLYKIARNSMVDIPNISYLDTLEEIGNFFSLYDIRYGAHNVPCMIDYQLIFGNADSELEGIDYINMYLERFVWENRFCSFFEKDDMISIYRKYAHDYIAQLINLCDPLYANAIGTLILGKDTISVRLTHDDQENIRDLAIGMSRDDIDDLIKDTNHSLCKKMGYGDKAIRYFDLVAAELASRVNELKFYDGINNIFISICY